MSKKQTLFLSLATAAALSFFSAAAFANHNPNSKDSIPEREGVYDEPGHPGVKVRVFVHREKPDSITSSLLACGLSDPDSTATVSAAGWYLPSAWTYNLNPSSVPSSVGKDNLATMSANAYSDWTAATGNKVAFTRGADTTVTRSAYDGRNIMAFGKTSGTALGVTYIRYYSSSGLVVDVDTILNQRVPWKWSNSITCAYTEAYDAENVIEHEVGHWLGLDDEYDAVNYQHATMYGYASKGEVKKVSLEDSDTTATYSIYNP